nr:methionine gamma-lyase-like [Tanacetum cinerariifolium]
MADTNTIHNNNNVVISSSKKRMTPDDPNHEDDFIAKKLPPTKLPSWEDPVSALANARHEFGEHGGVNMSIEASATFTVMEPETLSRMFAGELGPDRDFFIYSRHFNPTVLNLGRQMAALEGTEAAYCTASGMSAISKVRWLRKSRNHIDVVSNADGVRFDGDQVPLAFVNHYASFLGQHGETIPLITNDLFINKLNPDVAFDMVRNVSLQEVKEAIFSMGDDKSPRPDGYTTAFFKEAYGLSAFLSGLPIHRFVLNGLITVAGSDIRPPMLDRTDFESWKQRICLYCLGKDNGVNILKSIDECPFKMGNFRETLAEGALHLGPKHDRVFVDLTPEENEGFKADIRATNILLQGLKQSNYDQLYAYLKQHEAHVNENKMMLERYNQHAIDPLTFVSNVSPQQYPTQSSTIPQSTYVPPVTHQP